MSKTELHQIQISCNDGQMAVSCVRTRRKTICLQWKDGGWTVRAPLAASDAAIRQFLDGHRAWLERQTARMQEQMQLQAQAEPLSPEELAALKRQARTVFAERVAVYAEQMGVTYGSVTVRSQRTRWGSCSARGDLSLNCLLLLAPAEVLDSVVVHELCHRKEMNHSPRFYREVLAVLPDYRQREAWLKKNGAALLGRLKQPQEAAGQREGAIR